MGFRSGAVSQRRRASHHASDGNRVRFRAVAAALSNARTSVISSGGDVTAPQAELPDDFVWRAAGDAHAAAVDAEEVVGGAEADQVLRVVASSLRARDDVVRVHRRPAAAGNLAEVPVTGANAPLQRVRLLELRFPGLDEVLR